MIFHYYVILNYCINVRSSIIFCLSSRYVYLSVSISSSFVADFFGVEVFEAFVVLSAILLPVKSLVASAGFWITYFQAVLNVSVTDVLAWSRSF